MVSFGAFVSVSKGGVVMVMERITSSRGRVVMVQCGKREGREREGTGLGSARRKGVLRSCGWERCRASAKVPNRH